MFWLMFWRGTWVSRGRFRSNLIGLFHRIDGLLIGSNVRCLFVRMYDVATVDMYDCVENDQLNAAMMTKAILRTINFFLVRGDISRGFHVVRAEFHVVRGWFRGLSPRTSLVLRSFWVVRDKISARTRLWSAKRSNFNVDTNVPRTR